MKNHQYVIIYLDSVGTRLLEKAMPALRGYCSIGGYEQGFGYSINLWPEMFAGVFPDDLGRFNKWGVSTDEAIVETKPSLCNLKGRIIDKCVRWNPVVSRITHKLWDVLAGRENTGNIPFRVLCDLRRNTIDESWLNTVYQRYNIPVVKPEAVEGIKGAVAKDLRVCDVAENMIGDGSNAVVKLTSLDYIGHKKGPFSDHRLELASTLEERVGQMVKAADDDCRLVVCSDHPMHKVEEGVQPNVESVFGSIESSPYLMVIDGTMIRVWSREESLLREIRAHLDEEYPLTILSDEQRRYYQVRSKSFAGIIGVLAPGRVFWPSWYGAFRPSGMHGYVPEETNDRAIVGSNAKIDGGGQLPSTVRGIEPYLDSLYKHGRANGA